MSSLPNLSSRPSRAKLPVMGTSSLVTPQKPPRLHTPPRGSLERAKISTVVLNGGPAPTPTHSSTPKHSKTLPRTSNSPPFESSFTAVSGASGDAFYVKSTNPFRGDLLDMCHVTKNELRNDRA